MPKFEATFTLYRKDKNGKDEEFPGIIPLQQLSTKSTGQAEFWSALREIEAKLSKKYKGSAFHLLVTALEDVPGTDIKKGDIVASNNLELT